MVAVLPLSPCHLKPFTKNRKGFTLVELVVVIAILGILAGLAIPRFMEATATARGARIIADMRTLESAETLYSVEKGVYTNSMTDLVNAGYLAAEPTPPQGAYKIPESGVSGDNKAAAYTLTLVPADTNKVATVDILLGSNNLKYFLTKSTTPTNS